MPTLTDRQVTHQLSFDIGTAVMTDEITAADLEAFILALGFPRFAPALKRHVQSVIQNAIAQIAALQGPCRKLIGDAIAEQARNLAPAAGLEMPIPERDAVILKRP